MSLYGEDIEKLLPLILNGASLHLSAAGQGWRKRLLRKRSSYLR